RVLRSLGVLAVAERAAVHLGRIAELPGGLVCGGELVPRAERVRMVLAANALVVTDRRAEDGYRVTELVRRHEGTPQVEPRRDGAGMICPERAGTVGQGPLEPRDGLRCPARRQVRVGESVPGRQGIGVVRSEDLVGERGELPPVGDGG